MPVDLIVLGAAFLAGLLGTPHCGAMCGGIAAGLGSHGPAEDAAYRALASNLGRVLGYGLAGALAGGLGAGLLGLLALPGLATGLRVAVGLVLLYTALRIALPRFATAGALPALPLWRWLAPLRERLPAHPRLRPWAQGLLWGWLPCGLSLTLLTAAWLEASALHGALLMLAFGAGTLPAMVLLGYSGARLAGLARTPRGRLAGAALIGTGGLLTLAAPWLVALPAVHGLLAALGCRSLPG
ncbi:sulfite exporter TauE/SafE family protein [Silanimonas lenta]|uniref:sulfite exporter TauE/SafE family protein n=1 Tax=Silanimonas lenta TaxID=265429 RepID=UPI0003FE47E5|nr:sulfite exporter TauE/SafE family protein [Silanimonas lenta]